MYEIRSYGGDLKVYYDEPFIKVVRQAILNDIDARINEEGFCGYVDVMVPVDEISRRRPSICNELKKLGYKYDQLFFCTKLIGDDHIRVFYYCDDVYLKQMEPRQGEVGRVFDFVMKD